MRRDVRAIGETKVLPGAELTDRLSLKGAKTSDSGARNSMEGDA